MVAIGSVTSNGSQRIVELPPSTMPGWFEKTTVTTPANPAETRRNTIKSLIFSGNKGSYLGRQAPDPVMVKATAEGIVLKQNSLTIDPKMDATAGMEYLGQKSKIKLESITSIGSKRIEATRTASPPSTRRNTWESTGTGTETPALTRSTTLESLTSHGSEDVVSQQAMINPRADKATKPAIPTVKVSDKEHRRYARLSKAGTNNVADVPPSLADAEQLAKFIAKNIFQQIDDLGQHSIILLPFLSKYKSFSVHLSGILTVKDKKNRITAFLNAFMSILLKMPDPGEHNELREKLLNFLLSLLPDLSRLFVKNSSFQNLANSLLESRSILQEMLKLSKSPPSKDFHHLCTRIIENTYLDARVANFLHNVEASDTKIVTGSPDERYESLLTQHLPIKHPTQHFKGAVKCLLDILRLPAHKCKSTESFTQLAKDFDSASVKGIKDSDYLVPLLHPTILLSFLTEARYAQHYNGNYMLPVDFLPIPDLSIKLMELYTAKEGDLTKFYAALFKRLIQILLQIKGVDIKTNRNSGQERWSFALAGMYLSRDPSFDRLVDLLLTKTVAVLDKYAKKNVISTGNTRAIFLERGFTGDQEECIVYLLQFREFGPNFPVDALYGEGKDRLLIYSLHFIKYMSLADHAYETKQRKLHEEIAKSKINFTLLADLFGRGNQEVM